jgi:uncharacterized membrane protein YkvA (DUF1232 family)
LGFLPFPAAANLLIPKLELKKPNQESHMAPQPELNPSQPDLWVNLQRIARQAGLSVVEKALQLYYASQRPETPLWAKMVIYSALAYFILPTDAIPDFAPFVGYSDDLSALLSALATVALSITPEVKTAARQKAEEWLGDQPPVASSDSPQAGDTVREIAIE